MVFLDLTYTLYHNKIPNKIRGQPAPLFSLTGIITGIVFFVVPNGMRFFIILPTTTTLHKVDDTFDNFPQTGIISTIVVFVFVVNNHMDNSRITHSFPFQEHSTRNVCWSATILAYTKKMSIPQ